MTAIANQVKQLRQDCLGGYQRQTKLPKYLYTEPVPAITLIQKRQNCPCVDKSVSDHFDVADARVQTDAHSWIGKDLRPQWNRTLSLPTYEGDAALRRNRNPGRSCLAIPALPNREPR